MTTKLTPPLTTIEYLLNVCLPFVLIAIFFSYCIVFTDYIIDKHFLNKILGGLLIFFFYVFSIFSVFSFILSLISMAKAKKNEYDDIINIIKTTPEAAEYISLVKKQNRDIKSYDHLKIQYYSKLKEENIQQDIIFDTALEVKNNINMFNKKDFRHSNDIQEIELEL